MLRIGNDSDMYVLCVDALLCCTVYIFILPVKSLNPTDDFVCSPTGALVVSISTCQF